MEFENKLLQNYKLEAPSLDIEQKNVLLISLFLTEYFTLLEKLKNVLESPDNKHKYDIISKNINEIKNFSINKGALRCVEALAEYEKYCSIGDVYSCNRLKKTIFEELDLFKESWISMLC